MVSPDGGSRYRQCRATKRQPPVWLRCLLPENVTGQPRTISKPTLADKQGARERRAWCGVQLLSVERSTCASSAPRLLSMQIERIASTPSMSAAAAWAEPGEPALEAAADFAHAAAKLPAQQRAQRHTFGITDFGGDLIDAGLAGLEQMHGALDPQILEVFERRFAQHALHPARQRALAGGVPSTLCIRRASVRLLVATSAAA